MLRVCENCCEWVEEVIVSDEPAIVCPHCGYRRPFLRLPLFQVTGASASGKSRVCRDLPEALPRCVVLDQDILLSGLPWEQHRRNWLRVAMNISQGGRSTVLISPQLPEHYEELPERAWFSDIYYLALVCDNEKIDARLRQRPAWRGSTEERIAEIKASPRPRRREGYPTTFPSRHSADRPHRRPIGARRRRGDQAAGHGGAGSRSVIDV